MPVRLLEISNYPFAKTSQFCLPLFSGVSTFLWYFHMNCAILLWLAHRRTTVFLPHLNSHFSNRLFLLILSFLLLVAITTRPRAQGSSSGSHDAYLQTVRSRLHHLPISYSPSAERRTPPCN